MSSFTVTKQVSPRTGKVSWIARWDFLDDDGVRRHRKKAFRTRDEARAHRDRLAAEIRGGDYLEPAAITTGDYLRQWAAELGGNRAPSTILSYRRTVARRFGAIDRVPLAKLTRSQIERMLTGWQEEGFSGETRASAFRILRTALRRAVDDGLIKRDPTAKVEAPRIDRYRPTVWSAQQMQAFLAAIDGHRDGMLFRTILLTLMREGEAAALTWDDVDLDAGTLTVRRTLQRQVDGSWGVSERPKSDHGYRTIPLGADLVQRLREHRADQERRRIEHGPFWIEDGAVFDRGNGRRYSASSMHGRFKRLLARAGVPEIRIHDLRHGSATLLAEQGINIVALQTLLGHSNASFTMQKYVHPLEDERRDAVTMLETVTQAPDPPRLRVLKGTG
jgi:integrase